MGGTSKLRLEEKGCAEDSAPRPPPKGQVPLESLLSPAGGGFDKEKGSKTKIFGESSAVYSEFFFWNDFAGYSIIDQILE